MPYNSLVSRTDAEARVREVVSDIMMNTLSAESAAMQLFKRVNVPTGETKFPVVSALPTAYWVSGDTGLKQTTEMAWDAKYITIEELAAIVVVPDAVLEDSGFDVFGEITPLLRAAMARAIDSAIFFGTNAPASFPDDITTAAVAAGNVFARGTTTAANGGIAEDINQLIGKLLEDGYAPTGFVANPMFQTRLRSARDSTGQLLMDVNAGVSNIWGLPSVYPMPGLWPSGTSVAELFALQRENFVFGLRRDFTVDMTDTGVIQDNTAAIQYNLFQQDLTAIRVTMRAGWQVSNPINYQEETEADRYPAAVLRSPAS